MLGILIMFFATVGVAAFAVTCIWMSIGASQDQTVNECNLSAHICEKIKGWLLE